MTWPILMIFFLQLISDWASCSMWQLIRPPLPVCLLLIGCLFKHSVLLCASASVFFSLSPCITSELSQLWFSPRSEKQNICLCKRSVAMTTPQPLTPPSHLRWTLVFNTCCVSVVPARCLGNAKHRGVSVRQLEDCAWLWNFSDGSTMSAMHSRTARLFFSYTLAEALFSFFWVGFQISQFLQVLVCVHCMHTWTLILYGLPWEILWSHDKNVFMKFPVQIFRWKF